MCIRDRRERESEVFLGTEGATTQSVEFGGRFPELYDHASPRSSEPEIWRAADFQKRAPVCTAGPRTSF
eukprot:8338268-Pyramimonas_sp.AAC.1